MNRNSWLFDRLGIPQEDRPRFTVRHEGLVIRDALGHPRGLSDRSRFSELMMAERALVEDPSRPHRGWMYRHDGTTARIFRGLGRVFPSQFLYYFPPDVEMPRDGTFVEAYVGQEKLLGPAERVVLPFAKAVAAVEDVQVLPSPFSTLGLSWNDLRAELESDWRDAGADELALSTGAMLASVPEAQFGGEALSSAGALVRGRGRVLPPEDLHTGYRRVLIADFMDDDGARRGPLPYRFRYCRRGDVQLVASARRRGVAVAAEIALDKIIPFEMPQVLTSATLRSSPASNPWLILSHQCASMAISPVIDRETMEKAKKRTETLLSSLDISDVFRIDATAVAKAALAIARLKLKEEADDRDVQIVARHMVDRLSVLAENAVVAPKSRLALDRAKRLQKARARIEGWPTEWQVVFASIHALEDEGRAAATLGEMRAAAAKLTFTKEQRLAYKAMSGLEWERVLRNLCRNATLFYDPETRTYTILRSGCSP